MLAAQPPSAGKAPYPRVCADDASVQHARRDKLPKARKSKLGDLPRPDMELLVERRINGCTAPVRVRTNIQGDGRFANPSFEEDAAPETPEVSEPERAQDAVEP